jgi:hypothetical protein
MVLVDSLRNFGGKLKDCHFWIFASGAKPLGLFSKTSFVEIFQLSMEDRLRDYPLSGKVLSCAKAEEMASSEAHCMIWVSPNCLFLNPPSLLNLSHDYDVAIRPVHLKNIGSPVHELPDGYWKAIYRMIGVEDIPFVTESSVDHKLPRPYFNTHCFAINPGNGIMQIWREYFIKTILDGSRQIPQLQDELHRIFFHQALLSTILIKNVEKDRIFVLPPDYSYPLHLHYEIPERKRIKKPDEIVCAVYEEKSDMNHFEMGVQCKTWLMSHGFLNR